MKLSQNEVRQLFDYDPVTGIFSWRIACGNHVKVGKIAGTIEKKGYRQIEIKQQRYKAHRLAWFYMTGDWPVAQIDHVNGIKDDNRFVNLRLATPSQNKQNGRARIDSRSGYKGIAWRYGKWRVSLQLHNLGKQQHCGSFANLSDAIMCANFHITWTHGEFAQLNKMPSDWSHD